jgi:hypothetical protein
VSAPCARQSDERADRSDVNPHKWSYRVEITLGGAALAFQSVAFSMA